MELWESWGFGQLSIDGDELWLTDTDGVYRLRDRDLRPGVERVAESDIAAFGGSIDAYRAKLWLGPDAAWLTTARQAMRLAR